MSHCGTGNSEGQIVTVKASDIHSCSNGKGGWTMSYFGNGKHYGREAVSADGQTRAELLSDFVTYLNSIPIRR